MMKIVNHADSDVCLSADELAHPFTRLSSLLFGFNLEFPNWRKAVVVPPGDAPTLVCHRCANAWAHGVASARTAGTHQFRAIACGHGDSSGTTLSVAFITCDGVAPAWLQFSGVPCEEFNEFYFRLMWDGGAAYRAGAEKAMAYATDVGRQQAAILQDRLDAQAAVAAVLALLEARA